VKLRGRYLFVLSLAVACSDAAAPIPSAPSAALTVQYVAGGEASIASSTLVVARGPVELAPADTTYCVSVSVTGSTPAGPLDPERPQVDQFIVSFCGDQLSRFPLRYDAAIGGSLDDHGHSSVRANSVNYEADSGTVHVEPLSGGYAQVDVDGWYRPVPSMLPTKFRIVGRLVASE